MRINKARVCNVVRSKYPKALGIRKKIQQVKINRLRSHLLSKEQVVKCERDPSLKHEIISPYLTKWRRYLSTATNEMEDILKNAALYKDRPDKAILRDDIMFCYLAYGFLPSEYICFELENKSPKERKAFVSDIDKNIFGYSVNDITVMQGIINKGESYKNYTRFFHREGIVIEGKDDFNNFVTFVEKHPVFVKKAVLSMMGRGIELVDINKIGIPVNEYFDELIKSGQYLLEERVIQSESMSRFNPSSVNTIRCITLRLENDEVVVPWCFMRTGKGGSFVDNAGSGGLLFGVNPGTGEIISNAYDEYNNCYECHPDTGIHFIGERIVRWDEMLTFCKSAALEFENVSFLSWDMALTDSGWDVIEINEIGQFIGPQTAMKKGIKKELKEYFRKMKKVV